MPSDAVEYANTINTLKRLCKFMMESACSFLLRWCVGWLSATFEALQSAIISGFLCNDAFATLRELLLQSRK